MNGNEDSLQAVKYLGKVPALYPHGIGVAIVSIFTFIHHILIKHRFDIEGTCTYCLDSIKKGLTL